MLMGVGSLSRGKGGQVLVGGSHDSTFLINFLINFYTVQRERKQIRESIYYNDTTL